MTGARRGTQERVLLKRARSSVRWTGLNHVTVGREEWRLVNGAEISRQSSQAEARAAAEQARAVADAEARAAEAERKLKEAERTMRKRTLSGSGSGARKRGCAADTTTATWRVQVDGGTWAELAQDTSDRLSAALATDNPPPITWKRAGQMYVGEGGG